MKIQQVFEALSDENRRRILDILKTGEHSAGELLEHFDISGASLSHHLNKLKSCDLVLSKRYGQTIKYNLHTTVFEDAAKVVANIFDNKGKNDGKNNKK